MSGGHYDYKYYKLEELADDIERDFIKDGKYLSEDYSSDSYPRSKVEYDYLENATVEQRAIILTEIHNLIIDLRTCGRRAKELEWFMSGDTGENSYLERLNKIKDDDHN